MSWNGGSRVGWVELQLAASSTRKVGAVAALVWSWAVSLGAFVVARCALVA
jgi:hypothetical protein